MVGASFEEVRISHLLDEETDDGVEGEVQELDCLLRSNTPKHIEDAFGLHLEFDID